MRHLVPAICRAQPHGCEGRNGSPVVIGSAGWDGWGAGKRRCLLIYRLRLEKEALFTKIQACESHAKASASRTRSVAERLRE